MCYLGVVSQVDLSGDVVHSANPLRREKKMLPERVISAVTDVSKSKTKYEEHTSECRQLLYWDETDTGV